MLQGQWEEGFGYVQKGIAFHRENQLFAQLMWAKLDEIEYFVTRRQVEKGLALVDGALTDSEELAQVGSPVLRLRANLLALTGTDASDIDAAYCAAIDSARSQGAKYYELQAAISFARWLKSQGRAVEARTMLAEIYNWFTEGFDTVALKEAKALLDELFDRRSHSLDIH